jgi:UDP-N-acetylmuramate dehydrogenase
MSVRRTKRAALRNTFGINAHADLLIEADTADDLPDLFADELAAVSPLVVGGGSNLLIVEAPKVALHLNAQRMEVLDAEAGIVRAEAGVEWHRFVLWTLEQGFAGLENLALIPGTVGASPIQNIGAYGVEVGECIHAVDVFERTTGKFQRLDTDACRFTYRDSTFKHEPERWLVTAVEFKLALFNLAALRLDYAGIRDELTSMAIEIASARDVAEAVIRLRRRKLPDPAVFGNAGSFFKNPIVPATNAEALQMDHPQLPVFRGDTEITRKLSAAWLIDACGWKGHRSVSGSGDAGVSDKHALVLVNHGHATGAELLTLARKIARSVQKRFCIEIEPEPRIVGSTWRA